MLTIIINELLFFCVILYSVNVFPCFCLTYFVVDFIIIYYDSVLSCYLTITINELFFFCVILYSVNVFPCFCLTYFVVDFYYYLNHAYIVFNA